MGLAAACTVPHPRDDLTASKVAADRGEARSVYDRYSKVRANAIKLLDPTPLGTVESGPVLAIDTGALKVAKRLSQTRTVSGEQDLTIEHVYAPRLSSYPLWFVAIVRDGVRNLNKVQIFERESAASQWELVASPETLLSTQLPDLALDDGALEPVDPGDGTGLVAAPQQVVDTYATALNDPGSKAASHVVKDSFIEQMRRAAKASASIKGVTFTQKWGTKKVQFVLRTADGGALIFATLLRQDGYDIHKGRVVDWPKGSEQEAFLSDKLFSAGLLRYYHQVLLYVPPLGRGKPRALGQYGGVVSGTGY